MTSTFFVSDVGDDVPIVGSSTTDRTCAAGTTTTEPGSRTTAVRNAGSPVRRPISPRNRPRRVRPHDRPLARGVVDQRDQTVEHDDERIIHVASA